MSRTMKTEEAVMALAFMSNPEKLTQTPNSATFRDDGFGGDFGGRLNEWLTKLFGEKSLDLYSMGERTTSVGNLSNLYKDGTASTATPSSDFGTSCTDQQQLPRGVSFGTIEVRKYLVANPSVKRGVPRTIEWGYLEDETERHLIDAYERERPNEDRKRGQELRVNGVTKAKMLTNLENTKKQLFEGISRAKEHLRSGRASRMMISSSSSSKSVGTSCVGVVRKSSSTTSKSVGTDGRVVRKSSNATTVRKSSNISNNSREGQRRRKNRDPMELRMRSRR